MNIHAICSADSLEIVSAGNKRLKCNHFVSPGQSFCRIQFFSRSTLEAKIQAGQDKCLEMFAVMCVS